MTEMTEAPKIHNAKDILAEALDTIKATFWVQANEFVFVFGERKWNGPEAYDFSGEWAETEKAIVVDAKDEAEISDVAVEPQSNKAKITGVCSIGAIALANVTLYDEPLKGFDNISARDFETWKAGAALAMVIMEQNPDYYEGAAPGGAIAEWNDRTDRTREEVIEAFEKALEHPMLTATAPYELKRVTSWGEPIVNLWFVDQAAAEEFLAGTSPLREALDEEFGLGTEYLVSPTDLSGWGLVNAAS